MLSDITIINLDRVLNVLKKIKIQDEEPNRKGIPINLLANKLRIVNEEMGEIVSILINNGFVEYLHPEMKLNILITEKGIEFITKSGFAVESLQEGIKEAKENKLDRRSYQEFLISKGSFIISILALVVAILAYFRS